ncbi:MAG TPA: putative baseplate assembly protein [Chromatiales bacterium]|nr:putative baseplate assembly protein [Chromatiales bacterium]
MPLPVPNLDDRRFDDLVKEAQARLATHLPELTHIAPGDPVHSFIDLFAWLTETILYRTNLIPERQRRVFLNLLQIPVHPARPARGVVCVDAGPNSVQLNDILRDGAQLTAGKQTLTTLGELQPTNLSLQVAIKEKLDATALAEMGLTLQDLQEQFGLRKDEIPSPFQPRSFNLGEEVLTLKNSLDNSFYLACIAPRQLDDQVDKLRKNLAGITLNVGIAPADELEGVAINELNPRTLIWELVSTGEEGEPIYLPLDILSDSSKGGRQSGVVRLRLPRNGQLFTAFTNDDPMFTGYRDLPPDLIDQVEATRVVFWIRLRCPEHPSLQLGYLGLNAVDVVAQGLRQDLMVGMGTGQPDQVIVLPDQQIDASTLQLQVEENGSWADWQAVDYLAGQSPSARVFRLNADSGYVYFGDGISSGYRPPEGHRIRIVSYRFGGGVEGNLAAGSIKEIQDGNPRFKVRHDWPLSGGLNAETVEQAERRIPQFLTHRNRAVTRQDFKFITEANPVNPVARAEVLEGFLPAATIQAARDDVPGVVSVFVLPPAQPELGHTPKPSQGLLKDVFTYLLQRIVLGTELYVLSPEFVPIAISVLLQVREPETEQQTLRDVQQALVEYLWPLVPGGGRTEGWPMGSAVRINELSTEISRVEGVLAINAVSLFKRTSKGWRVLNATEEISLSRYQLPELMGVRVESGKGKPALPSGIGYLEGQTPTSSGVVAVPVIPDVC